MYEQFLETMERKGVTLDNGVFIYEMTNNVEPIEITLEEEVA